ncbi:MAG: hypothetical protein PHH35_00175 [Candidatus Pacebacteria bacterium]|jgi:hypothetical protein|nr:hypothetical protein [Candidatus Paceibacterota bacterium]
MEIKAFFKTFWGGVVITILILIIGYLTWGFFNRGGVDFVFSGTDEAKSGEVKEFSLTVENKSRVKLEEAEIKIKLPEGVFAVDNPKEKVLTLKLEEIDSLSMGKKEVSLLITGESKTLKKIEAVLAYRSKGISSVFEKKAVKSVLISGSSFRLEAVTLSQVFAEQVFPLEINWENLSGYTFDNVEVRVEWPTGFIFQESVPEISATGDNRWTLGELYPASQGKVLVKGFMTGQAGETKRIILNLGMVKDGVFLPLSKAESFLTVIKNPLAISSLVNSQINYNADLGETLEVVIDYQNNYSATLRNLDVEVVLKGEAFDLSTLKAPKATFLSKTNTLVWSGAKVAPLYSLNPGEKGTLEFSIKLKEDWPMTSAVQKNVILEIQTLIKSSNVPEQLEVSELPRAATLNTIKINSGGNLVIESYFRDAPSQIANTGSLPLRANNATDFTIHWKVLNSFNSLRDVKIRTTLPLWVEFTSQISGNYGSNRPTYDPLTREFSWQIDIIPAGSGIITKAQELIFQIKVTPSTAHINQAIDLIERTTFTATDAFTGKNINLNYPAVKSIELTDKTVLPNEGIVGL